MNENSVMVGTRMETVCSPQINSGMFAAMKEMGDVKAVLLVMTMTMIMLFIGKEFSWLMVVIPVVIPYIIIYPMGQELLN